MSDYEWPLPTKYQINLYNIQFYEYRSNNIHITQKDLVSLKKLG
jgi:hypothetical protein